MLFLRGSCNDLARAGRRAGSILVILLVLAAPRVPGYAATNPPRDTDASLGIAFVEVRAGSFDMGSPPTEWQSRIDEQQHRVVVSRPFLLATHEVTQRQWQAVMGENPSYLDNCPDCPVERVDWHAAVAFCNALSRRAGLEPAYTMADSTVTWNRDASGYRLPTEAEWEYACRAGSTTPYHTGTCLGTDMANFKGYRSAPGCPAGLWRAQALPVGSFAPNAWGFHDMHGNLAEWCWDFHAFFEAGRVVDPAGPRTGTAHVVRSGSFDEPYEFCRSASRQFGVPTKTSRHIGFRLARNRP